MANGTTYFTITINGTTGEVTFTQDSNVWHSDTGNNDDTSSLTAAAGSLEAQLTVTDADGDHASASLDLSSGVFHIQDDGPTAGVNEEGNTPTLTVDESPIPPGGDGVVSDSADFSGLFNAVDYGTDGPGSVGYSFAVNPSSPGGSVGSGLYALDASDTTTGDGDGIGQGDEIMLVQNSDGSVSGVANGTTYFTIEVDCRVTSPSPKTATSGIRTPATMTTQLRSSPTAAR